MAPGKRPAPRLVIHRGTGESAGRVLCLNPASASMLVTDQAGHGILTGYLAGSLPADAFIERLSRTRIFDEALTDDAYGSVPQRLIVELTTACNLRCKTCYMAAAAPQAGELATGEVKRLLADAARAGTETVAFIGGEPLMRPDLAELVEFARDRFADVMISTNGTLIDRAFLGRFSGRPGRRVPTIQVSLDGPDQESHDAIRGRGSFEKVSRLLDLAADAGVRTAVSSVLNSHNYNRLGAICDLAAGKGCHMAIFHKVHVSGRAREFPQVLPTAAELAHAMGVLLQKFDQYERRGRMIVDFPHNRCFRGDSTLDAAFLGCHFGRASAYITSEGRLACCSHLREGEFAYGDVRRQGLVDLWQNSASLGRLRRTTVDDLPACSTCRHKYLCRGSCRADALGASGSITGDPPDCDALRSYYDYVLEHYARTLEPVTPQEG